MGDRTIHERLLDHYHKSSLVQVFIKYTVLPLIPLIIIMMLSLDSTFWISSEIHHFYIELIAVILASILSFYYILRARALKDDFSLFVGIGFLISGLIDLLHVIVSLSFVEDISFLKYFIPQTWFAGRVFLSSMLLIAIIKYSSASKEEKEEVGQEIWHNHDQYVHSHKYPTTSSAISKKINRKNIFIFITILSLFAASIALSSLILVFPAAVLDEYSLHRPYEIPPLILFCLCLFFFYKKRLYLKKDIFYRGMLVYIIVDIFSQIIMSFSAVSFDTQHNISHVLKDVGYFVNIIALVLSSIQYSINLKENNNLIKLQYEKIKESEKIKNEFINVVAHELRTPIQPILGISGLLDQDLQNQKELEMNELKIQMTIINRNAKKLKKLTEDILDVTKIESNTLKLDIREFDLLETISDIIRDYISEIEKKKILIIYKFNEELINKWRLTTTLKEKIIINGDKNRIAQVLSNLLNNAIKFASKRPLFIKIELNEKDDKEIIVNVIDNGQGIDREMIPNLFKKFSTDSINGTGLGLYISKNIVEAHGGKIWAKNNENGIGSTFSFSLPLSV